MQLNDIGQLIKGTNTVLDELPNITDTQGVKKVCDQSIPQSGAQSVAHMGSGDIAVPFGPYAINLDFTGCNYYNMADKTTEMNTQNNDKSYSNVTRPYYFHAQTTEAGYETTHLL